MIDEVHIKDLSRDKILCMESVLVIDRNSVLFAVWKNAVKISPPVASERISRRTCLIIMAVIKSVDKVISSVSTMLLNGEFSCKRICQAIDTIVYDDENIVNAVGI